MVLASGLVREEADGYALTGPLPPLAIPPTVQTSLVARLEQLGEAKAVAQVGAVWGRGFTEAQLQAVAPLDRRRLDQALARLVEADILRELSLPPRLTYVFKHALLQEAAYASLLKRTRQQYHRQIAHVLETQFPETAEHQPELLARHYTEAGLYEQALVFWKRAGERTLARSAYREATMCFKQALGAVQQLPDSRDTHEQAIDLRLALRSALLPSGDLGRLLACLREAESLAATLDDPRRLGRSRSFCQTISTSGARMTRPSPPHSAPSRSLRPAEMSSCRRWRISIWASPTMPRATIVGPSTALGRPWHPSTGRSTASASVKSACSL